MMNSDPMSRSTASDETIDTGGQEEKPNEEPHQPLKKTKRKLTNQEIEHENQMCELFERKIAELKSDLTDKKVIFDKLMAELFRMLGVFDRLEKLHETKGNEIVEAETAVITILVPKRLVSKKTVFNSSWHPPACRIPNAKN